MNEEPSPPPADQGESSGIREDHRRVWQSEDLLGPEVEALILHEGETYRLRRTKQGKLILNK